MENNNIFEYCPLDSVYVGTHISYYTSSDYSYSPFYRNTTLRVVRLGDNVRKVYDNEFYGCSGLKTAIIGENVSEIGNYAFSDCTALTKLESHSATPPTCGTEALDDINKGAARFMCHRIRLQHIRTLTNGKSSSS